MRFPPNFQSDGSLLDTNNPKIKKKCPVLLMSHGGKRKANAKGSNKRRKTNSGKVVAVKMVRQPGFRRSRTKTGPNSAVTQFIKLKNYVHVDSVEGDFFGGSVLRCHYMSAIDGPNLSWASGGGYLAPTNSTTAPFGWVEMRELYTYYRVQAVKFKVVFQPIVSVDASGGQYGQIVTMRHDKNTAQDDLFVQNQRVRFCDKKNKWIMSNPSAFFLTTSGAVNINATHQTLKMFVKPTMILDENDMELNKETLRETTGTSHTGTFHSQVEPYVDISISSADDGAISNKLFYHCHIYVTYYVLFSGIIDRTV